MDRRREVSEVKSLLSETRLLTLTGVGGVGKTRLALSVASDVGRAFAGGVWLVELAALRDAKLLAQTIAAALGLRDESALSPTQVIINHLRDRRLLLVLDNCEHQLQACSALADALLLAAPELRILATSREPLSVGGEVTWTVPPLPVPESGEFSTPNEVTSYPAIMLFTDRARSVDPRFAVDADNSAAITRLCRRLDGIPLAIELAAVRLRVLSPAQILDRLDDRYRLLTRGYRNALSRHQTLWATIDWSFELCSPRERLLWGRLSVFSGGFDLRAVEDVCAGAPIEREEIVDLLAGLINKSILTRAEEFGQARYRMLETLRQYGEQRLIESGTQPEFRARHRDHYRRLAERAEEEWLGPRQEQWIVETRQDLANIRVALDFCLTGPDEVPAGLTIVSALLPYWVFHGGHSEASHWLGKAFALVRAPSPQTVRALAVHATIAMQQGDAVTARPQIERCRDHAQELGDRRSRVLLHYLDGRLAFLEGDLRRAVALMREAWNQRPDDAGGADRNFSFLLVSNLSIAATFHGEADAGLIAARCLAMAESAAAPSARSLGMWVVGLERWQAGDTRQAAVFFLDSLSVQDAHGERSVRPASWMVEGLAWTTAVEGEPERAACLLGAAEALRRSIGLSLSALRPYVRAHDDTESALRRTLGDAAYLAAFERGLALDFDEAIEYAVAKDTAPARSRRPAPAPVVLTPRERQVARLVAEGKTNKDIASSLVISQRTAENHVAHIFDKLGFTSRAQIAAWAAQNDDTDRSRE